MENTKFNFTYLLFLALVSAMGGFLFGYDWVDENLCLNKESN